MTSAIISGEVRTRATALAVAIYRVSSVSRFDPALGFELRKAAVAILADIAPLALASEVPAVAVPTSPNDVRRDLSRIENIRSAIAGVQELVRFAGTMQFATPENAERISAGYARLAEALVAGTLSYRAALGVESLARDRPVESGHRRETDAASGDEALNPRQRRIMEYLMNAGRAQISDLRGLFGAECSEKTLQRDLGQLTESGFLRRQGDNRWTIYILIRNIHVR